MISPFLVEEGHSSAKRMGQQKLRNRDTVLVGKGGGSDGEESPPAASSSSSSFDTSVARPPPPSSMETAASSEEAALSAMSRSRPTFRRKLGNGSVSSSGEGAMWNARELRHRALQHSADILPTKNGRKLESRSYLKESFPNHAFFTPTRRPLARHHHLASEGVTQTLKAESTLPTPEWYQTFSRHSQRLLRKSPAAAGTGSSFSLSSASTLSPAVISETAEDPLSDMVAASSSMVGNGAASRGRAYSVDAGVTMHR